MQYKPHKKYRHTLIIGGVLLAIALCFLVFANMGWGYLWLNQLGTILFLTFLIFLSIRYILYDYVYLIPDSGMTLEVKRISGALPKTIASVQICAGDNLLPYTKDLKKKQELTHIENCCVSLFPEESYLYICRIDGKKIGLRLECQSDLVDLLEKAIRNAPSNPDEPS